MFAGFSALNESIEHFDASLIKTIHLDTAEDFDTSLIPENNDPGMGASISLDCKSGLHFTMIANFQKYIVGTVNLLFSLEHLQQGILDYEMLKSIVFELAAIFQVSNGTIYDKRNKERLRYYYSFPSDFNSYPLEIGCISYFSPYLVESIGREKFQQLQLCAEKVEFNGGFLISSVLEPFQADNKLYLEREAQIIADLGLEAFVKF